MYFSYIEAVLIRWCIRYSESSEIINKLRSDFFNITFGAGDIYYFTGEELNAIRCCLIKSVGTTGLWRMKWGQPEIDDAIIKSLIKRIVLLISK